MASAPVLRSLAVFLGILVFLAPPASPQGVPRLDSYNGVAVRILQSNNAGNIHHIIDPDDQPGDRTHQGLSERRTI